MAGITITKDGAPNGSIDGPISCPPTATGTVDIEELGSNDLQVAQVRMTKDTNGDEIPESFGPSPCTIPDPLFGGSVSFDADTVTGGVICTPGDGTDALFTLVEPPRQTPVGGEILSIDTTALFVAGAFTNAYWILPAIGAAIAGFGIFRFKRVN